ncbi:carbohydrate ABC transporter permease [Cohnella nanjingensis]|uniref:Carbohydrate ABC transporter permease n=1 Tax=Cohnella nanjingensis TaxID=1387779 RepID=A0A7X0RPV8_9BACL|nr:carbohydrate ABC transporter permease [Cohnella nanjingensis]MBB6671278.1 carbohydrate ABC transporter permease [Cohnella nanjingensis]
MHHRTFGGKVFEGVNHLFLAACALLCIFPIIHVLAVSFSGSTAAAAGQVTLWPVEFNLSSYKYALNNPQFLTSFLMSLERVALGLSVNMLLTIFAAYPLSKERSDLYGRNAYSWYLFITIIFSGGLIPWYMTVKQLGLMDSVWALILPGAVPVFNVIILLNFFRQLPKEIGESAFIDGAGHWTILSRIYLPLSKPALATLVLFTCVGHWNAWFDGLILMSSPHHYPLQTYLQTIMINRDMSLFTTASQEELKMLSEVSDRTLKSAQIFIAAAPILAVYPFLQKYFMKGIVVGSVKG